MDSVTQATLGAVLGECLLARHLGNRAAAWGAVIGTLPDLDVLVFPWLDSVQRLAWHRGLSHSMLGVAVATPLLFWLLRRVHRERLASARGPVWAFVALNLATHVLIDCFNVYGTQVLEPFSRWRCAFGNLFIVDPAFTMPMLLATLAALFLPRESRRRRVVAWTGLGVSTLYAALSFALQAHADTRFAAAIERAGLPALRRQVASGPLTALYQRCLVDCGDALYQGYTSVLDPADRPIEWQRIDRAEELLGPLTHSRAVEQVRWFSQGWYAVRRDADGLWISDLRFGDLAAGRPVDGPPQWVFDFRIDEDGDGLDLHRPPFPDLAPAVGFVVRRALGRAE